MSYKWTAAALVAASQWLAVTADAGEVRRTADAIPGSYIVVLQDSAARLAGEDDDTSRPMVAEAAKELLAFFDAEPGFVYDHVLRGFSVKLSEEDARLLADDERVAYVEQDGRVRLVGTQSPTPSWGLDRVDQRYLPLNSTYIYDQTGAGVRAYIIDTGISAHADFGSRLVAGYTAINDGRGTTDCNGHGTHVAGTVGGTVYGVAKSVTLVPVRVLDCGGSGTWSQVIAGVNWVTSDSASRKPAVANMSLGGGANSSVDSAVANSISSGVPYAIAAGNSNANACNYSPARVAAALTVGATASNDARASFSNYGSCLDLFAPGQSITSTWLNGGTNTISGTSMASPHVAGGLALYLQTNPTASSATASSAVINNATVNVVTSAGTGSPNRLLYTRFSTTPALSASISVSGWTLTCNASGGTPPYTYRWYVRYCEPACDPICPVNGPDLPPLCYWTGPFTSSPANQWTIYGDENQVRCNVTDAVGTQANAYY